MGANEVAGFDPIFYLHHCFIDYAFGTWQRLHGHTAEGSIVIDPEYKGTKTDTSLPVPEGAPPMPVGTPLTLDTPLYPFLKADARTYYASKDLVDIENQLGYTYAVEAWISSLGKLFPVLIPAKCRSYRKSPGSIVGTTWARLSFGCMAMTPTAGESSWGERQFSVA